MIHNDDGEMQLKVGSLGALTACLLKIEQYKIGTFIRLARAYLEENENHKVTICCNYRRTIDKCLEALEEYEPRVLDGGVSLEHRKDVLRVFQRPDTDCRIIIGNLEVLSTGIDLVIIIIS